MRSICSIGWKSREVYLRLFLIIKYRIGWFCTCKVRLVHRISVARLLSWNNHGLKKIEVCSFYFSPRSTVWSFSLTEGGGRFIHQAHQQREGEVPIFVKPQKSDKSHQNNYLPQIIPHLVIKKHILSWRPVNANCFLVLLRSHKASSIPSISLINQ